MDIYGPVPSRRLGRSLGINNIPAKICSYSCIYCQIGRNTKMLINREEFYEPEIFLYKITEKIKQINAINEKIDYITFVPDGEPTLDKNIKYITQKLKKMQLRTAIITNSSLIWREDVREDLYNFDLVSIKIDTIDNNIWKKINRPFKGLRLEKILEGIVVFSDNYTGDLLTETMLVNGVNDNSRDIIKTADFISKLDITTSYIAIPTRPPTEKWVTAPDESKLAEVYQIFTNSNINVEYLIGYEGNVFTSTNDDVVNDILSITSVHPMREEAIRNLLNNKELDFSIIKDLINKGLLIETSYNGKNYYLRKINKQ